MSKIGLIIQREYLSRVRKKSFFIITILGPLLFGAITILPTALAMSHNEHHRIVVVDETYSFCGILTNTSAVKYDYRYCSMDSAQVKHLFKDSEKVSVLFIPKKLEETNQLLLFSKQNPGEDVVTSIEREMNTILERSKMKAANLDQKIIDQVKTSIKISNIVNNKITNTTYSMALGYMSALLIYVFIFFCSVQVMRGVMEEKTNRIVEVIISSVKPFQLMMGKVIGVGLVGLTQFLLWITASFIIFSIGTKAIQKQVTSVNTPTVKTVTTGTSVVQQQNENNSMNVGMDRNKTLDYLMSVDESLRSTNWFVVVGSFLFFFLGGYMLYSSLFAAIGSAVDQEADSQQFMLPVTAPLIVSIIVMGKIIEDPHGTIAFWFSMFPLTSPIAMMARIPFGIPYWQVGLSMVILVASIFLAIWIAGRIYRVGLLMYGKKITYKELGKWLFYK